VLTVLVKKVITALLKTVVTEPPKRVVTGKTQVVITGLPKKVLDTSKFSSELRNKGFHDCFFATVALADNPFV